MATVKALKKKRGRSQADPKIGQGRLPRSKSHISYSYEMPSLYRNLPPVLTRGEELELFKELEVARAGVVTALYHHPLVIDYFRELYEEIKAGNLNNISQVINLNRAAEIAFPEQLKQVDKKTYEANKAAAKKSNKRKGSFGRSPANKRSILQAKLQERTAKQFVADLKALYPMMVRLKMLWDEGHALKNKERGPVVSRYEGYQEYIALRDEITQILQNYPLRRKRQKNLLATVRNHSASIPPPKGARQGIRNSESSLRLSAQDVRRLYKKLSAHDEVVQRLEKTLVERNIRLSAKIARSYAMDKQQFHDLIEAGFFGIATAHERFQYRRGYKFSTIAVPYVSRVIQNEILRQTGLSVEAAELIPQVKRALWILKERDGVPEPEPKDIKPLCTFRSATLPNIQLVMDYLSSQMVSYDAMLSDDPDSTMRDLLGDDGLTSRQSFHEVVNKDLRVDLERAMDKLNSDEIRVIKARFGIGEQPKSLVEIGGKLGKTSERIRQIQNKALEKLQIGPHLATLAQYLDGHTRGETVNRVYERPNMNMLPELRLNKG